MFSALTWCKLLHPTWKWKTYALQYLDFCKEFLNQILIFYWSHFYSVLDLNAINKAYNFVAIKFSKITKEL